MYVVVVVVVVDFFFFFFFERNMYVVLAVKNRQIRVFPLLKYCWWC